MKILSAQQIREADAYTIEHEPIRSVLLMERAASECAGWMVHTFGAENPPPYYVFCGMGNNGGDGLVIARLLKDQGFNVQCWLIHHRDEASEDNLANQPFTQDLQHIHSLAEFPVPEENGIIVDAILGTGTSRAADGWLGSLLHKINDLRHKHTIVSIDMPSGMLADQTTGHAPCIHARYTLSFQFHKLAFMLPENAEKAGQVVILKIGLHPDFIAQVQTKYHLVDDAIIRTIYQPRDPFAHKGTYGHSLLIAGSYGKMGAALLSARACLRAGAGLLTAHIPRCGYNILQMSVPEAMCETDEQTNINTSFHTSVKDHHAVIGIGPGIGTDGATAHGLEKLLDVYSKPMVIDADALNIISQYPHLLHKIPHSSILTPHPKEFERLFGPTEDQFERLILLSTKAQDLQLYILLKGRYSAMACPDGAVYFNPTGNPGMATAGSGDVLTGILTGLLSQNYTPKAALLLGAWLHGLAGDVAADENSEEAIIAEDIINYLGAAFLQVRGS